MKIAILDDYQNVVPTLACFAKLTDHSVVIFNDSVRGTELLAQRLQDIDALVLIRERTAVTRQLLERLPRLRLISVVGPVPHIDLQACAELGVTVCCRQISARPSYATAELTWGLVLAAWRRIPQEMAHLKAGGWQSQQAVGIALRGRTLGIYGYGRIGTLVATYGRAFGMRVIAWGREGSLTRARADGIPAATGEHELFSQSDVLSLHLALNESTIGIVRREHLTWMKPTALIVNTSRARLIEEGALLEALEAGRPGLAAVDVFEEEPVLGGNHPLLSLPQAIATPHLGYLDRESLEIMFDTMFEQVQAFAGGAPINALMPPRRG